MKFEFSDEFLQDLEGEIIRTTGQRLFLLEALEAAQNALSDRPRSFLRLIQEGSGTLLNLEAKGKVHILRGQNKEFAPRFLFRFLNSPSHVLVATCNLDSDYWMGGEVTQLRFSAILEIESSRPASAPSVTDAASPAAAPLRARNM